MVEERPVTTPLAGHFKLFSKQCPQSPEEEEMSRVPYASMVGSLMYAIVCTRPDLTYVFGRKKCLGYKISLSGEDTVSFCL